MINTYIVTGTLTDAKTLILDEPLPMSMSKVRVVIEPIPQSPPRSILEIIDEIHARHDAEGRVPTTKEAIDAFISDGRQERGESK